MPLNTARLLKFWTVVCLFAFLPKANAQTGAGMYSNSVGNYSLQFDLVGNGQDRVSMHAGTEFNNLFVGYLTDIAVYSPERFKNQSISRSSVNIIGMPLFRAEATAFADENRIYLPSRVYPNFSVPKPSHSTLADIAFLGLDRLDYSAASVKLTDGSAATYIIRVSDQKILKYSDTAESANLKTLATADFFNSLLGDSGKAISKPHGEEPAAPSSTEAKAFSFTKRIKPKVTVEDSEGKQANAWDVVKSFTTDLSAEAEKKAYHADPSSDEFARSVSLNLLKPQIGSIAILGPGGTGKTTDVANYVSRIVYGRGPQELQDYTFLMINPSALTAGTRSRGSAEARISALVEIAKAAKVIFVVDEIHSLRGAGSHSESSSDIFDAFKPLMAEGQLKMIGMSTDAEFNKAFGGDSALMRRWGIIKKVPPTGEKLNTILRGWMTKYSDPSLISDDLLNRVVYYSDQFNAMGAQPAKAVAILELIGAIRKVDRISGPITNEEIQAAVKEKFNLHPDHFDAAKIRARLLGLSDYLDNHVVGQTLAKKALVDSVKRAYMGTAKANLPKGRKIISGPPGLGKTEIVKALAAGLERPFVRIMMSDFKDARTGPDAFRERLADAMQNNVLPVILFDEIEKAATEVQQSLLNILDDGKFTVSRSLTPGSESKISQDVDMRNTLIYMASNAGQSYIESLDDPNDYVPEQMQAAMIKDHLNDLIFDRMDGVVPAMYLSKSEFQHLEVLEMRKTLKTFKENNPQSKVQIDKLRDYIRALTEKTWKPKMSNRVALKAISQSLETSIADAALMNGTDYIHLKTNGGNLEPARMCKTTLQ